MDVVKIMLKLKQGIFIQEKISYMRSQDETMHIKKTIKKKTKKKEISVRSAGPNWSQKSQKSQKKRREEALAGLINENQLARAAE